MLGGAVQERGQHSGLPAAAWGLWSYSPPPPHTHTFTEDVGEGESCLDHQVTQLALTLSASTSSAVKCGEVPGQGFLRGI